MADKKPIIGINLDYFGDGITPSHPLLGDIFMAGSGCHAPFARHIINYNFVLAVEQAGGIPLIMPHAFSAMEHYIDMVDGFMFIGGTIDLPPETYGEEPTTETLYIQDQRARFDLELMRRALRTKKPILGICAGAQLLNVVRGGTLHQHIPDAYKESEIEHFQFTKLTVAVHVVHDRAEREFVEVDLGAGRLVGRKDVAESRCDCSKGERHRQPTATDDGGQSQQPHHEPSHRCQRYPRWMRRPLQPPRRHTLQRGTMRS